MTDYLGVGGSESRGEVSRSGDGPARHDVRTGKSDRRRIYRRRVEVICRKDGRRNQSVGTQSPYARPIAIRFLLCEVLISGID
jgi:hypothetical protein